MLCFRLWGVDVTESTDIVMECAHCHQNWPADRFNPTCSSPDWCFKCRASGLSVAFAGGKDYFHDATVKERTTQAVSEARANGLDPVPAHVGKAYGGTSAAELKKIGSISKEKGAFGGKPTVTSPTAP